MIMIRLHINVCVLYFQWSTITVEAVPPLVLWPPTTNSTNSTRKPTALKLCTKYSCWLQRIIFFQHLCPVQLACSSEQQAGSLNADTFKYGSSHTTRRKAPYCHPLSWRQSYRQYIDKQNKCLNSEWILIHQLLGIYHWSQVLLFASLFIVQQCPNWHFRHRWNPSDIIYNLE